MTLRRQLYYALSTVFMLVQLCEGDLAGTAIGENSISNLYENLLQREYPEPVVFPNHQVERKAQRSPSLRLRFGRRNDPDLVPMPSAEKRWFGDVHQKPIRSPSLRLRFGRRSDPSIPLHSNFDILMNNLASATGGGVTNLDDNALEQDYDGTATAMDGVYDSVYERTVRKPQRLRWGRSVPVEWPQDVKEIENDQQYQQHNDNILNSLINSERFQKLLLNLRHYNDIDGPVDNFDADEFSREVRKPAPLRLRWGRSTGGVSQLAHSENDDTVTQNKQLTQNSNTATSAKSSTQENLAAKN